MPDDLLGPPLVVKIGGSLFDLPDLGSRLGCWLERNAGGTVLLVPGGGPFAEAVRNLDRRHGLDADTAHWLAIRAMTLSARLLQALLGSRSALAEEWEDCRRIWQGGGIPIIEAYNFLQEDERHPDHLPHTWSVSSDSIAARIAVLAKASRLNLLKSVSVPEDMDWPEAARQGFVDEYFRTLAQNGLEIRAVNFRAWRP